MTDQYINVKSVAKLKPWLCFELLVNSNMTKSNREEQKEKGGKKKIKEKVGNIIVIAFAYHISYS